jgi:hypothetical protein
MSEDYHEEREQAIYTVLKAFPSLEYLVASGYAEALSFLERVMTTEDYNALEEYPVWCKYSIRSR